MGSDYPIEGDKLKKLIKKSRSMPIPFGFNPGTAEDDDEYLAAHARKAPEILGKLALTEGAGTRSAFGTFAVDGSEVHLTCFRTIAQLAKKFKKYLKRFKITLNCVVMDPDGNVIDSDVEKLDDWFQEADDREVAAAEAEAEAAEVEAEEGGDDSAIDPADLAARLRALQPKVAAAPPGVLDRVTAGFAGAVGLVKAGRLEAASITIAQLEAVMARLAAAPRPAAAAAPTPPPAPPPPPRPQAKATEDPRLPRLREAVAKLSEQVGEVLRGGAGPLLDQLSKADGLIDAGEAEAALGAMRAVQDELRIAQGLREKWEKVRETLEPMVGQALSARSVADVEGVRTRWNFAAQIADEGGWQRAIDAVPPIIALLRQPASAEGATAAAGEPPKGVVAVQRARVVWQSARSRMLDEAQKLVDAITGESADDDDAAEIAEAGREIMTEVAQVDDRLQDVLDRLTNAAEGRDREALKREATGVIAEYRQVLSRGIFPLLSDNPFASVSVAETADIALNVVAQALAA